MLPYRIALRKIITSGFYLPIEFIVYRDRAEIMKVCWMLVSS